MIPNGHRAALGVVTEGSYTGGLTVRLLEPTVEDLQVGSFVVLEGERNRYFSLISDLQLRVTDPGVLADPPTGSPFVRRALHGVHTYAAAMVRPSLVLEDAANLTGAPRPTAVRTIPAHFAAMLRAEAQDFDLVFGSESNERFALGSPLAMPDTSIPVDLARLIERPSGIFGQTGAGKSVLARLILFGLIKSRLAATLIFDMHDEYADGDPQKPDIPGLRSFFSATDVLVYQLDPKRTTGTHIRIGLNHIQPDDIELLRDELDLNDTFFATTFALHRVFGDRWLAKLLNMESAELQEFAATANAHPSAVEALQRKLRYLQAAPYTSDYLTDDPVGDIVHHLERGQHVIVQFGPRFKLRDYLLVANLLTRRIHGAYTERSEREQLGSQRKPLVVVLEEAHKFLNPVAARQSIFGTIAREMRKYGVTLLVVDQRPSGIDSEILSQLGTRITGLLSDSADIEAVLSGAAERTTLRALLASLEPSRQCLIVGHAIPMPMVLQTREYSARLRDALKEREELAAHGGSVLMSNKQRRLAD